MRNHIHRQPLRSHKQERKSNHQQHNHCRNLVLHNHKQALSCIRNRDQTS